MAPLDRAQQHDGFSHGEAAADHAPGKPRVGVNIP
jgi:hypothetical protein